MDIEIDTLVDDIMRRWPETLRVFLDYRMSCVGCPIAVFHTVDDSCREHGVDAAVFLAALRRQAGLSTDTEMPRAEAVSFRRV
jgi:hybrid cluster-associated redox disulfide protein